MLLLQFSHKPRSTVTSFALSIGFEETKRCPTHMVSAIIADGYLLKKKRDDRRNFLASKYQRRYFELTGDTLAYAKGPKELKDGGGDIEFFAIHELKYIKKLEDCKLEMKFPERVLRVKAESPKEHDRWYEAIKDARQKKLDGNGTPQAKQLETLKEHTKQQMLTALEEDTDDEAPVGVAAAVKKADPQLIPLSTSQQPTGGVSNRPPSPRSLLANPRMGTRMIAPAAHKNLQQEEMEEPSEATVKPRSRWQDEEEEEEEEEEAQPQRKPPPPQQQQQPKQGSGANGKHVTAPVVVAPPPASERLMLDAKQESHGNPAKGAVAAASDTGVNVPQAPSRGEKLQLGEAGRQVPNAMIAAAAPSAAVAPVKRSSRENAEKLSLGGPTAPLPGSRGGTPPVAEHSGLTGDTAPTGGPREEWEDDDWDSSDDDEEHKKRSAAAAVGPARKGQTPSGSGIPTAGAGSGRPGPRGSSGGGGIPTPPMEETCKSGVARPRRSSGGDRGPRAASAAVAPGADGIAARMSNDRGGTGARPSSGASGAVLPISAGSNAKGKAQQVAPPREQQRQEEDEEEEDKEAVLAKHAAGTDHLDDNWDSDEEQEEKEESPRKPQGRAVPVAPAAPSPRQPAAKTSPPGPQRRIPGPPPAAPAPTPAARPAPPPAVPHASAGISRPPTAPKQLSAAPPPSAPGVRPRARVSQEGSVPPPPHHHPARPASGIGHAGGTSVATRHKVDLGSGEQPFRSNVVHDPHVKPDNNNWVEENWDDDD